MSRLDSFIRRLEAQRACLDHAARAIAGLPGPVLELGLGNGRTYDHLRELLPEREIFVFERQLAAHPASMPDAFASDPRRHLRDPAGGRRPHRQRPRRSCTATSAPAMPAATPSSRPGSPKPCPRCSHPAPGSISDQPMRSAALAPQPPPAGIAEERYFLYRHLLD